METSKQIKALDRIPSIYIRKAIEQRLASENNDTDLCAMFSDVARSALKIGVEESLSGEAGLEFQKRMKLLHQGYFSYGAQLIAVERKRQVEEEGYDAEHDKEGTALDLLDAGLCYGVNVSMSIDPRANTEKGVPKTWPWDAKHWKPTLDVPARQLVKAGALIAAAIDRLNAEKRGKI